MGIGLLASRLYSVIRRFLSHSWIWASGTARLGAVVDLNPALFFWSRLYLWVRQEVEKSPAFFQFDLISRPRYLKMNGKPRWIQGWIWAAKQKEYPDLHPFHDWNAAENQGIDVAREHWADIAVGGKGG